MAPLFGAHRRLHTLTLKTISIVLRMEDVTLVHMELVAGTVDTLITRITPVRRYPHLTTAERIAFTIPNTARHHGRLPLILRKWVIAGIMEVHRLRQ